MNVGAIVGKIAVVLGTVLGVYFGLKSGYKRQKKQDDRVKKKIKESEMVNSQLYFILRIPLSVLLGWGVLSFVFSLNGLTIILPYMVNSTILWNWIVFLLVNFFVGALVWRGVEKVYSWK